MKKLVALLIVVLVVLIQFGCSTEDVSDDTQTTAYNDTTNILPKKP